MECPHDVAGLHLAPIGVDQQAEAGPPAVTVYAVHRRRGGISSTQAWNDRPVVALTFLPSRVQAAIGAPWTRSIPRCVSPGMVSG